MSVNINVSIPDELAVSIHHYSKSEKNESEFIKNAVIRYIQYLKSKEQQQIELDKINRIADHLNEEMQDSLQYQIPL